MSSSNVEEVEEYKNIPVIFYAFNGFILGDSSIFFYFVNL